MTDHPWIKSVAIALLLFGLGVAVRLYHHTVMPLPIDEPELVVTEPKQTPTASPDKKSQDITVQLTGGVIKPGIYTVAPNTNLVTVIRAAGGLVHNADITQFNLSKPVSNNQSITIPVYTPTTTSNAAMMTRSDPVQSNAGISLNNATLSQLQQLPGVGPATAKRIVTYRTANGRFATLDDLTKVKGIGPKKLAKLKPFLTL